MTRVLVTKEGGGYKIQYALQDKDLAYTSADGTVKVTFVDYENPNRVYWQESYEVEKSDFKKYETLLGGELWGHVIIVAGAEVPQYGSDTNARMKLRFETAKGAVFEVEDTFFL